jgi:exonuclease SbcD
MIKLLHTADLHLGKIFHDQSLIEDQRAMLDQLTDILAQGSYDALLIAGDVYDRSIPSPEAVELFSAFLGRVKSLGPSPEVLILPGNHDSASRLGFGKELFAELGVHLVTDPEDADRAIMIGGAPPGGGGALPGERGAVFLLPFLYPGSLREDAAGEAEPIRSPAKLAETAAARLEKARLAALEAGAAHTVLGAHLFTAGGIESESERIFLGNAEGVPADLFGGFDYVALGHLHRFQRAGANAWYSGSPLAYSFEEGKGEKVFLSVELSAPGAPELKPIPVKPLRKMRSLRGPFNYFFQEGQKDPVLEEAKEDYLEITLTGRSLVENPLALLRRRFPRILSVKQDEALAAFAAGRLPESSPAAAERRSPAEDFAEFLTEIYGAREEEKLSLFRELLASLTEDAGEEGAAGGTGHEA